MTQLPPRIVHRLLVPVLALLMLTPMESPPACLITILAPSLLSPFPQIQAFQRHMGVIKYSSLPGPTKDLLIFIQGRFLREMRGLKIICSDADKDAT